MLGDNTRKFGVSTHRFAEIFFSKVFCFAKPDSKIGFDKNIWMSASTISDRPVVPVSSKRAWKSPAGEGVNERKNKEYEE